MGRLSDGIMAVFGVKPSDQQSSESDSSNGVCSWLLLQYNSGCCLLLNFIYHQYVCLAITCHPSVCLPIGVDHDHLGWKSWKLIARTLRPTPSLFVA